VIRALALAVALLLGGVAAAEPAARPATGKVLVVVSGLRSTRGKVLIALFDRADGFPDGRRATRRVEATIQRQLGRRLETRTASAVFDRLPPGQYAVAVLHDEDGDREMDTGLFGIPAEGYGASNGARGTFGPPRWKDASFDLASGAREVQKIRLIHH
jgi:uncharacterized protein (DUF2141 family)